MRLTIQAPMPRRAGASLANSVHIQLPEFSSQDCSLLRTHWKWAAFCQFLTIFSPMLNMADITPNVWPCLSHFALCSPTVGYRVRSRFWHEKRCFLCHAEVVVYTYIWQKNIVCRCHLVCPRLTISKSGPASTIGNPPFVNNIWNGILFPILWVPSLQRHGKQSWENIPQRMVTLSVIQRK